MLQFSACQPASEFRLKLGPVYSLCLYTWVARRFWHDVKFSGPEAKLSTLSFRASNFLRSTWGSLGIFTLLQAMGSGNCNE